ncbi:hypothetical protein JCM8202_005405 [Rhodotorula sphaerocarpa]
MATTSHAAADSPVSPAADSDVQASASPLADPVTTLPPSLPLAPPARALEQEQHASDPAVVSPTPLDRSASTSSRPSQLVLASDPAPSSSYPAGASGVDSPTPATGTGAPVPPQQANAGEGSALAGSDSPASTAEAPMSSVEKVDDAASAQAITGAPAASDTSGEPTRPAADTATPPPVAAAGEGAQRESTVSQTVASDSATSTPKVGSAPASTAAPAPAASSGQLNASRPRAPQQGSSNAPKKRKSGFSFLACLPCFGSTGHEEEDEAPQQPQRKPSPEKQQNAAPTGASSTPPVTEKTAATTAATEPAPTEPIIVVSEPVPAENEKAAAPPAEGIDPETAMTPPTDDPLEVAASPADDPVSNPPPTAPASQRGVVLPAEETEGVTSGAVVPPGQVAASQAQSPPTPTPRQRRRRAKQQQQQARTGTESIITSVPEPGAVGGGILLAPRHDETTSSEFSTDDEEDDEDEEDLAESEEEEDEEQMLIARGGVGIPIGEDGLPHPLLDDLTEDLLGRKCLVLDLDETLVHSSFKMVHQADFVVPVEIENQFHNVYVIKRPGVDAFLKAMGEIYEVVVFTASLSKYADPVLDHLDIHRVVKHRLFRESCYNNKGNYVKDLSQLGRPIGDSIIIDNSPASYVFHPNNAVPISSWFNDPHDTELTDLIPFLADLATVEDVRSVLDANLYLPNAVGPEGAEGTTAAGETDGITSALQQL